MLTNVLSIDWLSLYCHDELCFRSSQKYADDFQAFATRFYSACREYEDAFDYSAQYAFDIAPIGYGSKVYAFGFDVHLIWRTSKYKFARVYMCPRSEVINANSVSIKIENYMLYKFHNYNQLSVIIDLMLRLLKFRFINVSRLDVCKDFHCFDNGMRVVDFIAAVSDGSIRRVTKNRAAKLALVKGWNAKSGCYEWQSLRFGGHDSLLSAYIYNKSLEIAEVSHKDYITDFWRAAGLTESGADVWRLEFSVDGEYLRNVTLDDVKSIPSIGVALSDMFVRSFFDLCMRKGFDMRFVDAGKRVGKWERLGLFSPEISEDVLNMSVDLSGKLLNTNRTDRIVLKYLAQLNCRADVSGRYITELAGAAQELVPLLAAATHLSEWYRKKCLYWRTENVPCNDKAALAGSSSCNSGVSAIKYLKSNQLFDNE